MRIDVVPAESRAGRGILHHRYAGKAGQERTEAFQQLARRAGIEDIQSLSTMIIQRERFGASLSQALKVYANDLRMRPRLRANAAMA